LIANVAFHARQPAKAWQAKCAILIAVSLKDKVNKVNDEEYRSDGTFAVLYKGQSWPPIDE